MRFLHLSDTHLGYNQYGLSERGKDFFDAFNEAIEIAIERKVDFIIHTGDFFHSSRPSNRVIVDAINILSRLKDRNIPIFTISGNHDRGSNVKDVSPLNILQSAGLTLVDQKVVEYNGVFISGIKYISKAGLRHLGNLRGSIERLLDQTGEGFKILMLHQEFYPLFPESGLYLSEEIPEGFNYVGIGHYHIFQEPAVINKAVVVQPGSTEFTAYHESEEKIDKGVYIVDVDKDIKTEFVKLNNLRPFVSVRLEEDKLESILKNLKEEVEKKSSLSGKKVVVIFRGRLKDTGTKEIVELLEDYGFRAGTENILHINFNVTREIQVQDVGVVIENEEKLLSSELKKILGDIELYETVKEVIDHLRSFESIDDAKKYLKENPDILEL
ncbi:metallophosphoesterase family protein [Persephonella sp.]